MSDASRGLLTVRILLTVVALEFFGPIFRDFSASHAFNPAWVGHARVHLVLLLVFMAFSGLANVYLIWLRRPKDARDLWLSVAWQSCSLGGFWLAYLLTPVYQGEMTMPGFHVHILGVDENVFVFSVLSALLVIAAGLLARQPQSQDVRATR
jgi:hypothetical protein